MSRTKVLVTGAGGFIGHHLCQFLADKGYWVRGVDLKYPEFGKTSAHEFYLHDLREYGKCLAATKDVDLIYNLAADMGGIAYISSSHAAISRNNSLINLNMLEAARVNGARKFLFSSSACIYPGYLQKTANVSPLKETDDMPADPEAGYGWEKLYTEKMCEYYSRDFSLNTRIVRFHNVYGPEGTWEGGKEKAPAALCRKISLADNGDEIEIWGDGKQTRSFMYIDDCVKGIDIIMESGCSSPFNLGNDRLINIDDLACLIANIAGKRIIIRHNEKGPQGVRGRNSDNTRMRKLFGWSPEITLEQGLEKTYNWIEKQVCAKYQSTASR